MKINYNNLKRVFTCNATRLCREDSLNVTCQGKIVGFQEKIASNILAVISLHGRRLLQRCCLIPILLTIVLFPDQL